LAGFGRVRQARWPDRAQQVQAVVVGLVTEPEGAAVDHEHDHADPQAPRVGGLRIADGGDVLHLGEVVATADRADDAVVAAPPRAADPVAEPGRGRHRVSPTAVHMCSATIGIC